jgi:nucleoporin NUP1
MFRPKKPHTLILMHENDDSSRLNTSGKKKGKGKVKGVNGIKPYAGEGGMKKLLARRKMEEEREKVQEDEDDNAMEDDTEELAPRQRREHAAAAKATVPVHMVNEDTGSRLPPIPPTEPESRSSSASASSRERSSLRVGRTKTSRNHIARPVVKPINRFSALYDDDDGDDQMQDDSERKMNDTLLNEAAKKAPIFDIPSDFSFANVVRFKHAFELLRTDITL